MFSACTCSSYAMTHVAAVQGAMLRLKLIAFFLGAACAATPQATQLERDSVDTATNRSHSPSESLLSHSA